MEIDKKILKLAVFCFPLYIYMNKMVYHRIRFDGRMDFKIDKGGVKFRSVISETVYFNSNKKGLGGL